MYIRRPPNSPKVTLWAIFLLQAANWHFLTAQTLVSKNIYVGASDCGSIVDNLRILKFCLVDYDVGLKMQNFQAGFE
jgi:hypothetical protein